MGLYWIAANGTAIESTAASAVDENAVDTRQTVSGIGTSHAWFNTLETNKFLVILVFV
jgi:hypothetical protein